MLGGIGMYVCMYVCMYVYIYIYVDRQTDSIEVEKVHRLVHV